MNVRTKRLLVSFESLAFEASCLPNLQRYLGRPPSSIRKVNVHVFYMYYVLRYVLRELYIASILSENSAN